MKRFACLLLAVLLTVSLCGCGGTQESRLELFAMDTYMVITAEGGMCGTYLRTQGQSGKASLTVSAPDCESVRVEFTILGRNGK